MDWSSQRTVPSEGTRPDQHPQLIVSHLHPLQVAELDVNDNSPLSGIGVHQLDGEVLQTDHGE
jgi:hypothetical protein